MSNRPSPTATNLPADGSADAGLPVAVHYQRPGWFTKHVFNRLVRRLTRMGMSIWGSAELRVPGRQTGEWRSTPVNPLRLDGEQYLVAPRGETQWVRNLRVSGSGELRIGRRVEAFTATELTAAEKPEVLREYLRRWKAEVGVFFDGVGADADHATLLGIADQHPVFKLRSTSVTRR